MGKWIVNGIGAGVGAAIASLVFWWLATGPLGIPKLVVAPGSAAAPLSQVMIAGSCIFAGAVAGLLAGFLSKREGAAKTFTIISVVMVLLSLISPVMQPAEVPWSTRWVLILLHLIAFAAIWGYLNQELKKRVAA